MQSWRSIRSSGPTGNSWRSLDSTARERRLNCHSGSFRSAGGKPACHPPAPGGPGRDENVGPSRQHQMRLRPSMRIRCIIIRNTMAIAKRASMRLAVRWVAVGLVLIVIGGLATSAWAQADGQAAAVAWRLLDYIGVDYDGAVASDGRIVSQSEYDEMMEFAHQARDRLTALPATPAQPSLIARSEALRGAIARKAPPAEVAVLAKSLKDDLLAAWRAAACAAGRACAVSPAQCERQHGPIIGAKRPPLPGRRAPTATRCPPRRPSTCSSSTWPNAPTSSSR